MNPDEDMRAYEDAALDTTKVIAGVIAMVMLVLGLFRYGLGFALEYGGPFALLATLGLGLIAITYLSIHIFRLVRKMLSHRKTIEQKEG